MIKAIITDIEGTTTSLSFVKDVLFPYARAELPAYIREHNAEAPIKQILYDTSDMVGKPLDIEAAIKLLVQWLDEDKKITPLKTLQGLIWTAGYQQGHFTGHVYQDAIDNLLAWHAAGYALYVYSSGSVLAQKLLFSHTPAGDLTPLFSGFFDTNIGGKKEADSYRKISDEIGLAAENLLFLSDIKEELDAAAEVGYCTYWLNRDSFIDNAASHPQAATFAAINPQMI
jgi:enolase-phosphatase E1